MNESVTVAHSGALCERYPLRATSWQLRTTQMALPTRPLLMGIVNVTPDSFSDGGSFLDPGAAVAQGLALVEQGADLLDIGGESTRPYATPVDAEEERRRVMPVIRDLAAQTTVPISIDTTKASVAADAIAAGAEIINDVTGLQGDRGMLRVAQESRAGLCIMHMQGTVQTMQDRPCYDDVVGEVLDYLYCRRESLVDVGIPLGHICLDVGIGFGKTPQHNLQLLASISHFHALGCPLLVGHSRKGFLGKIIGDTDADRTHATVGVGLAMAYAGVQILRVHNVAAMRDAILAYDAVGGIDGRISELESRCKSPR